MKNQIVSGVYSITHIASGRGYVGSARNISKRWGEHRNLLNRDRHPSPRLQNTWNKYGGETAFRFEILETCLDDPLILIAREQNWIDQYKQDGKLLNSRSAAEQFSSEWHRTEEAKEVHEEHGRKLAKWWENRELTTRICVQCGNEFKSRSTNNQTKYCSVACSYRSRKERELNGERPSSRNDERSCVYCKKSFFVEPHSKTRFCSIACFNHDDSVLTPDDVVLIIRRAVNGERTRDIAKDYGIVSSAVTGIVRRTKWAGIPIPEDLKISLEVYWSRDAVLSRQRKKNLSDDDIREIRQRSLNGESQSKIARDFGITQTTVSEIKANKYKRYQRVEVSEEIEAMAREQIGKPHKFSPKLTPDHVAEIKSYIGLSINVSALARRYSVHPMTIEDILSGKRFRDIEAKPTPLLTSPEVKPLLIRKITKLNQDQIEEIKKLAGSGKPRKYLARLYGVGISTIARIVQGIPINPDSSTPLLPGF